MRLSSGPSGTLLALEDLSDWAPGGNARAVAGALRRLHDAWEGKAESRWPWLRSAGAVSPEDWRDTCDAYGAAPHLVDAMPAALVQGFLSLADFAGDAESRIGWIRRIEASVGVVRDR